MSAGGRFGVTFRLTWAMVATSQGLGILVGVFAIFPFFEAWFAPWVFLGTWVASTTWLLAKRSPIDAMGSGFYGLALLVFLTPFKQYLPTILSGGDATGALGARLIAEGAQGLLTWATVCSLLALCLVAMGRYCNRLSERIERERLRASYR